MKTGIEAVEMLSGVRCFLVQFPIYSGCWRKFFVWLMSFGDVLY